MLGATACHAHILTNYTNASIKIFKMHYGTLYLLCSEISTQVRSTTSPLQELNVIGGRRLIIDEGGRLPL